MRKTLTCMDALVDKLAGAADHAPATDVEVIKDQLRATWKLGQGWRLEFGRLLIKFRAVCDHGTWVAFLESEFRLHRQTAFNWMNKAKEADGVKLDEETVNTDEPDAHAETVSTMIDQEREKVNEAIGRDLNGPKSYRIILEGVTEDEKDLFKAVMKMEREWVQGILRQAFNTIIAGKPFDAGQPEDVQDGSEITDTDLPESFFGAAEQPEEDDAGPEIVELTVVDMPGLAGLLVAGSLQPGDLN